MKYIFNLKFHSFSKILLNNVKAPFLKNGISLPIKKKKFTVLTSPHVDKKSRDQFEMNTYKKIFIYDSNYYSDIYINNVIKQIPAGVGFSYILKIRNF